MARRRLTIKRLDPWSVLKFGAVANVVLLAIFLLVAGVIWFIVDRLQLVDQACGIATDVGFTSCGVNAGNLFQALALLGALWTVIQTAVLVFLAFLHNLIADLTGGLMIGVVEEGGPGTRTRSGAVTTASTPPASTQRRNDAPGRTSGAVSGEQRSAAPARSATAGGTPRPARGASGEPLFDEDR